MIIAWLAAAGLALMLFAAYRELLRERAKRSRLELEIQAIERLTASVNGRDWRQSANDLLEAVVQGGFGKAAALLVSDESGTLELRHRAGAAAGPDSEALANFAAARKAMADKAIETAGDVVFLPFVGGDEEVIGVLAVLGGDPSCQVLRAACRLAELSLIGARLSGKQATISNTDGLTGLANHRHFQQMLGVALGQVYLEGEPLALILMDIDRFKQVNDNYGHLLGDLVLKELARTIRQRLPKGAFAARYGGEEIAIILQGVNALRASEIAEDLRQAVESQETVDFTTGAKIKITISMGVALYELGEGKNRLIARADEALYASKNAGRNCITVSEVKDGTKTSFPA